MTYELGNWMAAVVLPTPAGPNMNSFSRLVTASGFLARRAMTNTPFAAGAGAPPRAVGPSLPSVGGGGPGVPGGEVVLRGGPPREAPTPPSIARLFRILYIGL